MGYDLAGIRGASMQRFLDRAAHARGEIEARLAAARAVHPDALDITAPEALADSVTLSTMHGCPPEEIERIAAFLLQERGLHTSVKLNPTLLGAGPLRELLHGRLGWDLEVPDDAFARDPDFATVVGIIRSLQATAARAGRRFGVKLTNTLPCRNRGGALPEAEATRYLSGRALHPLAVAAAARLQEACGGELDISFAGGADAVNTPDLLRCGLRPVTVCSDLLRPGGYLRLRQYLENIGAAMATVGAADLDGLITGGRPLAPTAAALANLQGYAETTARDPRYRGDLYADRSIRTARPLTAFDCVAAPCVGCCPTGQDIPGYMHHTARGEFAQALAVVRSDNPLPVTAGMVCDHPCQQKCTRLNYEAPVRIRDVKRFLARYGDEAPERAPAPPSGRQVAVVGAGPAGLACAKVLAMAGVAVEIFEARDTAGGMVTDVIPRFRLDADHFARDLARIEALGVRLHYGQAIDRDRFAQLREAHDAVFVAVGAQADRPLGIPGEDSPGVEPALVFLAAARQQPARRLAGRDGGHRRRQQRHGRRAHGRAPGRGRPPGAPGLPAHRQTDARRSRRGARGARRGRHRARAARPVGHRDPGRPPGPGLPGDAPGRGRRLGAAAARAGARPHRDDRRRHHHPGGGAAHRLRLPGRERDRHGARRCRPRPGRRLGRRRPAPRTGQPGLGHGRRPAGRRGHAARLRPARTGHHHHPPAPERGRAPGPGRAVDRSAAAGRAPSRPARRLRPGDRRTGRGRGPGRGGPLPRVRPGAATSAWRSAPTAPTSPTRRSPVRLPLVAVLPDGNGGFTTVPDGEFRTDQARQTAHVADFCNHCGNCTTFCPTAGQPFVDKPRFAMSDASWAAEDDIHRLERDGDGLRLRRRHQGREQSLTRRNGRLVWETEDAVVELDAATFAVGKVRFLREPARGFTLREAAALAVLLDGVAGSRR